MTALKERAESRLQPLLEALETLHQRLRQIVRDDYVPRHLPDGRIGQAGYARGQVGP